jgi:methylmalonyl-CoA carboxyltransferase large subunit
MAKPTVNELTAELAEVQAQVAALMARLERLESAKSAAVKQNGAALVAAPEKAEVQAAGQPAAVEEPAKTEITQEEVLAISAALAAYLGVRVHIKQVRLLSTHAWAQEGRVSIQASHRLHS